MKISEEKTISEIVTFDYRTASVFDSLGIDYCCKGNRSLLDVCESRGINSKDLIKDLKIIIAEKKTSADEYKSWTIEKLIDHIVDKHHRKVESQISIIKQNLEKVNNVHSKAHPELSEIKLLFDRASVELIKHMKKEELILFPFIKRMSLSRLKGQKVEQSPFGTVQNPVQMMKQEHDTEGERFKKIAELTNNYLPPADACNTLKITYNQLKEFEADLHLHIHLENNILFPKAIELEKHLKSLQHVINAGVARTKLNIDENHIKP